MEACAKNLKSRSKLSSCEDSKEIVAEPLRKETEVFEHTQQKPLYDFDILQEILSRSKRYKKLKPTALPQIIGEQPKYEYIKKIAVARLEDNFRKQCALFSQITNTKEDAKEAVQTERLLHGVFSWKWSDFLERRKEKSFVWVDILLRKKEHFLHYLKFQSDMKELQFLVNKLFHDFLLPDKKDDIDGNPCIVKIVDETNKTLYTLDNLEKEYHTNSAELHYIVYKEYYFTDARRNSEEQMLKSYLENRICNCHILDPIEIRYQVNWFDNLVSQKQYKSDSFTRSYQADISHLKELENMESFVDGNCLDYCYSSMESYKSQINELQSKYDKELDEMDTKLTLLRLQIEKIKEQRNFLSSEIQRFHDEEKIMQLQEENNMNNKENLKELTVSN